MNPQLLLTLIHISDLHFGRPDPISAEVKDWWCKYPALSGYFGHCGRALRYLNEEVVRIRAEEPNSLLLVTGDLTAYAAKDQFETALGYLRDQITLSQGRKLGLQLGRDAVKMIPGNHDQWSGKEAQKLTDLVMYGGPSDEFRSTFPAMPVVLVDQPLSKDRKLVIIGIDTDAGLSASSPDRFLARGSFVRQLQQAEDLLDDDGEKQLRVLMLHHSRMHRNKVVCGIDKKSQAALEQFIRRHRISVLLTGHVHVCDSEVETVRHENSKWWLYESGVWGAVEQKTGLRRSPAYSSSGASPLLKGRSCPCATASGSAKA